MKRFPQARVFLLASVLCVPGRAEAPPKTADLKASRAFAVEVAKLVRANDLEALSARFSADALLDRALRDLSAPKPVIAGFRTGFKGKGGSGTSFWRSVCRLIGKDGSYTLLRVRTVDGKTRALFRLLSRNGLNYHDLILEADADGKLHIVDVYTAMNGELMSENVRRIFLLALGRGKKGAEESNLKNDFVAHAAEIQRYFDHCGAGRYREALKEWENLPASIRKEKATQVMHVTCAAALFQEDAQRYEKAMDDFRKAFPKDPAVDLVTLDGFFLRKQYKEYRDSLDRIERGFGRDPYLDVLRATGFLQEGKTAEAKKCAGRALKDEPDLFPAHEISIKISLRGRDYKETAQLLDGIEKRFHFTIGDLTKNAAFAEFVKSPEYKEWMAARKKK